VISEFLGTFRDFVNRLVACYLVGLQTPILCMKKMLKLDCEFDETFKNVFATAGFNLKCGKIDSSF